MGVRGVKGVKGVIVNCQLSIVNSKKNPAMFIIGFINSYQEFFEAASAGRKSVIKTAFSNNRESDFYVCN